MNIRKAKLMGIGGAVPAMVSNREFVDVFGKKAAALDRRMTLKTRYCGINIRTGEALTTNTGMALDASLKAMAMAGIAPDDVDMILYSSATPDFLLPPCYTILQRKLGIKRCMGMDLRSGCSGFGAAMVTAQQYIQTGMADTVLV
ncbi:hypothetical protein EG829_25875, partial [bacterium]|nr:hypothetical protein [bacterium]